MCCDVNPTNGPLRNNLHPRYILIIMKYSPYSQSLDEGLFPPKEPWRKAGLWKWILIIGCVLFFIYRSTLPLVRLQSEPPSEFIGRHAVDRRQAEPEKVIAQAYWNVAVQSIQWKYSPKRSLPYDPPPNFRINEQSKELSDAVNVDRNVYWRRLRDVWQRPDAWRVSYGWNTDWVNRSLMVLQEYANDSLQQFVQQVRTWRDELGNISIS